MITRKLIANIWRTPTGEILQSKHRHDMQVDSAGNYIDGGIEGYTRRGGDILNEKWENLCVYADDPHEKIRDIPSSGLNRLIHAKEENAKKSLSLTGILSINLLLVMNNLQNHRHTLTENVDFHRCQFTELLLYSELSRNGIV